MKIDMLCKIKLLVWQHRPCAPSGVAPQVQEVWSSKHDNYMNVVNKLSAWRSNLCLVEGVAKRGEIWTFFISAKTVHAISIFFAPKIPQGMSYRLALSAKPSKVGRLLWKRLKLLRSAILAIFGGFWAPSCYWSNIIGHVIHQNDRLVKPY